MSTQILSQIRYANRIAHVQKCSTLPASATWASQLRGSSTQGDISKGGAHQLRVLGVPVVLPRLYPLHLKCRPLAGLEHGSLLGVGRVLGRSRELLYGIEAPARLQPQETSISAATLCAAGLNA